jgi:hypothetical protein
MTITYDDMYRVQAVLVLHSRTIMVSPLLAVSHRVLAPRSSGQCAYGAQVLNIKGKHGSYIPHGVDEWSLRVMKGRSREIRSFVLLFVFRKNVSSFIEKFIRAWGTCRPYFHGDRHFC